MVGEWVGNWIKENAGGKAEIASLTADFHETGRQRIGGAVRLAEGDLALDGNGRRFLCGGAPGAAEHRAPCERCTGAKNAAAGHGCTR
jgi:hypothetical protein